MPNRALPRTALLLALAFIASAPALAGLAASVAPRYGSALPRFALFGWASPPRDSTTFARYAELAGAGFNVTMVALDDSGTWADNRARLAVTRPLGLRNLLLDNELDSIFIARPSTYALADSIVARYRGDPAFLGYYLGDEPPASYFPRLGEWFAMLRQRDPAHPAWNSLAPRGAFPSRAAFESHVRAYAEATRPAVLCNNQYDFQVPLDQHWLTENIATIGAVARQRGIPFWGVVQLVEHHIFRHVTEGMLRWQVAQWLAGGATGIGYFTYWTPPSTPDYVWQPAMIEWGTGLRTPMYDTVAKLNSQLLPLGNVLSGLTWSATQHAGSVPPGGVAFAPDAVIGAVLGRATLGRFTDPTGVPLALVANSDSAASRGIRLTLANGRRALRLRDDGAGWDSLAVAANGQFVLVLGPGDFTLLRLPHGSATTAVGPAVTTAGLSLTVTPSPGRGALRLAIAGARPGARLEIFDSAGRRVWTRAITAASVVPTWHGERDAGGRASPGVYLVRLSEDREAVTRRVVWLGAR